MRQTSEIAIVGHACRLPGANSTRHLWTLLLEGRCAVTKIPTDRWSLDRFGHPRQNERGRSYTWAAGVLDDIWGFDAAAFGLSPREAEQMDPQQRLLLELTWEALEDAGIRPSSLAGSEVGVFVGASTTDHGTSKMFDVASSDGYFATGNAASILANRISYIYDLNGPSFTVDTACSSSLVALDAAVQALRAGRIDTAIVGGVSILTTPFQFVNFSQASMLSRTGLCQAFSAKADGYVRSEGGGVVVLRTMDAVDLRTDRVRATIAGVRVNSDGRTNGIALPSAKRQGQLLRQLYGHEGIDPNRLAFVEAHGTGTPVGDPIEAAALGEMLGQRRSAPLPIGSVKSNIGHTEAAAGLAGLIKAILALEHDLLPASLHCPELNPNIDFEALNLAVATRPRVLDRSGGPRLAGISSYGFGGTNAHVVIGDAPPPVREAGSRPAVLMLSAHSRAALGELATLYADRIDANGGSDADAVAAAANHCRDRLSERLVLPLGDPAELPRALRAFAGGGADAAPEASVASAVAREAPVAFVYTGNGGQWVGMGRAAYRLNDSFRDRFDAVDAIFRELAGWSLATALNGDDLGERLAKTSVAQPLIFAIQAASTFALAKLGLVPDVVFGHSVGEVAAAEAAGALDLAAATRLIFYRSLHQERAFEAGGMTVMIGSRESAETAAALSGATIAAYNSPRAFTLSGSTEALAAVAGAARSLKARTQKLDIAYPFHSPLIDSIEQPLLADLASLAPGPSATTFVSTVTGEAAPGPSLDATYWWRNVREPVLFARAVEEAARLGARVFVEIGPSPILLSHVNDTLSSGEVPVATLAVLERKDVSGDPFTRAAAVALSRGAGFSGHALLGSATGLPEELPSQPWQRKAYRLGDTIEALGFLTPQEWHPLIGARYAADQLEWHAQIDTALLPELADHVVDGHVLLPGSAFAEMALAVARDWLGGEAASIADFEIHAPMILASNASRDVRCRVQPATSTVEIMSRARLGQATWQTHAVAKILHPSAAQAPARVSRPATEGAPAMTDADLYPLAVASGLDYGPAFRLLDTAYRAGPGTIVVDLTAGAGDPRFGLDPMRVDACFHGLALLYRELAAKGRLKPYVPVAAGEINLYRPGVPVAGAHVDVVRSDERTIIVTFTLLDSAGVPVARLYRMRFQAMSAFRGNERAIEAIVATTSLATEPLAPSEGGAITAEDVTAAARAAGLIAGKDAAPPGDYVLMEGWATATAFGLFEVLADDGRVDLGALAASGRLPQRLSAWCARLLAGLERSGLVRREDEAFVVQAGAELPDPQDILRALAADHPERSAELLLAARTGAIVDALAAGRTDLSTPVSPTAIENYDYAGVAAQGSARVLADALDRLGAAWPTSRALRVLQIGDGPLTAHAARLAGARAAELTIVEPDRRRLERGRLAFEQQDGVFFEGGLDKLAPASFDVVIAAQAIHRIAGDRAGWSAIAGAMAPAAVLAAVEPESSVFGDLVFGLHAAMTDGAGTGSHLAPVNAEAGWARALAEMELSSVAVLPTIGTDYGLLCVGQKITARPAKSFKGEALVVGESPSGGEAAAALATMLRFAGLKATSVTVDSFAAQPPADMPDTLVYLAGEPAELPVGEAVAERLLGLKAFVGAIGARKLTLWLVCPGATRARTGGEAIEAGLWAFGRTLANEHANLEVKLVDLVPGLALDVAARRLRDVVLSGTPETDIVVDATSTHVLRYGKLAVADRHAIPASETTIRLVKSDSGHGLDRLQWHPEHRRAPDAGEVEIAVEAAGLNFRDVMWGLSILPEEILEDGYAGATLGLECAGRIVRVGPGVTDLEVGDTVLAFAKAALSSHVTVTTNVVAPLPQGLSTAAAATVPVAFLTAYYALIRCARLAEDEWVLIHGGAGGVGLAAMQIARWRGARIIATAGSTERRDLLLALGAEHVFDSRSHQFVDDIRRVTGSGVDVVLNSLSGEAMERSIAVLRPFGRFVELGKRDYVANTHIGLKPFRRNLSYFGVDLDQLILKEDSSGKTLFEEVIGLFAEGALTPLPYRTVAASETVEAFRIMQRSGHIGKIVILPPPVPRESPAPLAPFAAAADGVHLITGGFGGFGLETARWLVEHGARHLMLVGRSGAVGEEAQAAIQALQTAGAEVTAERLDITDESAVQRMMARFGTSLPRLAGVIHAAAVLDDAIIANLTRAKLDTVLAAKATGAEILDRATRKAALDYFILYSSATTVIGNPGQGAYVAANGYLEGLAAARRKAGLPGLAVAWGAIQDVGLLTRSGATAVNLLARAGVVGMPARGALDRLAELLPQVLAAPDIAVVTVAAVNWAAAREHLPVLRSRSFGTLMHGLQSSEPGAKAKIRVKTLIERDGAAAASKVIVETVLEEIARILRLPKEDVSRNKPLMEIGLDSLMAVELGMGLEERFELEAPLSTSAGAMTVAELADYIVGTSGGENGGKDQTSEDLALRHLGADARKEIVATLPSLGADARSSTVH